MRWEFHRARLQGRCRPQSFSHSCRQDWLSRLPVLIQTQCADCRKKVSRQTVRAQKGGAMFFSWQYKGGEKGGGERQHEDYEICKAAKKELKHSEEPALAVNVPDRQENLRHERNP